MARFFKRRRVPHANGVVGNHNVGIRNNRHSRPAEVFVNGERYVKDRIRFRDLSTGEKGVVVGAYAANLAASSLAGYGLHKAGQAVDAVIGAAAPFYEFGKATVQFSRNILDTIFSLSTLN